MPLHDVAVEAPVGLQRALEIDQRARNQTLVEARPPQGFLGELHVEALGVGPDGGQATAVEGDRAAEWQALEQAADVDPDGRDVTATRDRTHRAGSFDYSCEHLERAGLLR